MFVVSTCQHIYLSTHLLSTHLLVNTCKSTANKICIQFYFVVQQSSSYIIRMGHVGRESDILDLLESPDFRCDQEVVVIINGNKKVINLPRLNFQKMSMLTRRMLSKKSHMLHSPSKA
ncbi:hypothetical protein EB796_006633 [Bugula neritina]|uniref:Uncharacterized protein n=1 Tax=Bugula neritina TaxID=10212 RepID=A0A7J7KBS0_BUGNE|nr:hypothetical protein EB796_006633 [Bugula neritina]